MAANLTTIHAEPLGEGIRDLLVSISKRAEAGEFSSIAVAYVTRDGCVGSGYSSLPSRPLMVGSLAYLQQRLILDGR